LWVHRQTPKALYTFQPALSLSLAYNINDKQGRGGWAEWKELQ